MTHRLTSVRHLRSSLAEFVAAVNEAGLADRVRYLRHGDTWPLAPSAATADDAEAERTD